MRTSESKSDRDHTVAIVGAGMSGLSCARQLVAAGFRVRLFDKGRGVGGRVSVRRSESGTVFDHGAQYFTVQDAAMAEQAEQVEHWTAARVVAPWKGRIGSQFRTLDTNRVGGNFPEFAA